MQLRGCIRRTFAVAKGGQHTELTSPSLQHHTLGLPLHLGFQGPFLRLALACEDSRSEKGADLLMMLAVIMLARSNAEADPEVEGLGVPSAQFSSVAHLFQH